MDDPTTTQALFESTLAWYLDPYSTDEQEMRERLRQLPQPVWELLDKQAPLELSAQLPPLLPVGAETRGG